jgi:hypothetical protein
MLAPTRYQASRFLDHRGKGVADELVIASGLNS